MYEIDICVVAWGKRGVVAKCVTEKMTFKVKVSQLVSKHTQGVRRSCNRSQIMGTNGERGDVLSMLCIVK